MTSSSPFDSCSFAALEQMANEAATGNNCRPQPTPAQAAAGNYKMGRVQVQGLDLRIENVRGSVRSGTSADGKAWESRMAAHYGYIAGTIGADGDAVDVFVGPVPESQATWVINQRDKQGSFDEHKVMLGFANEEQARSAYLHSYERGWTGLASIVPASIAQLKWWLRHGNKSRAVTPDQIPHEGEATMDQVRWSGAAEPINTTIPRVMYDLRRADQGGLLLDSLTMAELMDDPDIEGRLTFDALVVEVGMLQRKMEQLLTVMKAAASTVKPLDFTIADPVKMRGTMQIAVIFAMDDGQAVTVWLHNPDTTPNKLTPMDELVSWKWMLNKKDVSIVVAPESGRDLNAREVARRVMKLTEKNSEAFKRANARAADLAAQHAAVDAEIPVLEAQVAKLQDQVEVARIAKADGEIARLATIGQGGTVPSVVEPTPPTPANEAVNLQEMAQELANVLKADGYWTFFTQMTEKSAKANLSQSTALDLKNLVEGIVGADFYAAERAKFNPEFAGRQAFSRGEPPTPPETLDDEQRAQWLAGWEDGKASATPNPVSPPAPSGEVVGEATEVKEEPAAELTGEELGQFPDSPQGLEDLRNAAFKYLMDELRTSEGFFCPALQANVLVQREGAKKIKSLGADQRKLRIVKAIPQIIEHGKKFRPSSPSYAGEPGVVAYHYLRCVIRLAGESIAVRTVVKEKKDGSMLWDNTVHPVDAIFDSAKENGSTEVDPHPVTNYKPGASADADQVAGDRPYVPPQQGFILDDAGAIVNTRLAVNIFIEGEDPEFVDVDETSTPVEVVDAVYRFAQATERFKEYISETVSDAENSMFATAKAIDQAAQAEGATISWDVEEVGIMDAVEEEGSGEALDRVEPGLKLSAVGRIQRAGVEAGRALIRGDGAASFRKAGDQGEQTIEGDFYGEQAATAMVNFLFGTPAVTDPQPAPAVAEDGNIAVLRSILAGESDSAHLSLTLATIEACVNVLNDAGLLTGEVEQLAQDAITYWANLDEKVNG